MINLCFPARPVLCASGFEEVHNMLRSALGPHRLVIADTGDEALRTAHSGIFDAYLIDYSLPDWSGVQMCRQIRSEDPHVPIVMLGAASAGEDIERRSLRAGANVFYRSCGNGADLARRVSELLVRADSASLAAKVHAEHVTQAELERQRLVFDKRAAETGEPPRLECNARIARAKTYKAFIERGGITSHFERWWPQIYASELAAARAASEHAAISEAARLAEAIKPGVVRLAR
jgi:DNA-binding response OmpR family regulator